MKTKAEKRMTALRNLKRQLNSDGQFRINTPKAPKKDQAWRDRVLYEISILQSRLTPAQLTEVEGAL